MKPPRYTFAAPIKHTEPEETLTPWRFFIGVIVFFVAPFLYGFSHDCLSVIKLFA